MPPYPVKRSYLVDRYGKGVTGALNELMDENKLLRVKRGYYSLSDELLDVYEYPEEEEEDLTDFLPNETLLLLLSSYLSQYTVKCLVENNLHNIMKEVKIYTTTDTGSKDNSYQENTEEFINNLSMYRLTDDGQELINMIVDTLTIG